MSASTWSPGAPPWSRTTSEPPGGRLIREFPFPEIIGRLGVPSVLITRSDLQQALLEAARASPHPRLRCLGFETGPTGGVRVTFEDGRVGARGPAGRRGRLPLGGPPAAGRSGALAGQRLHLLAGGRTVRAPRFAPGSVIHYWGSGRRFGLVDMGGGRLYRGGTKNMPAERSHGWKGSKEEILRTYARWADEVVHAIEVTPEESVIAVPSRDRPFLERWGQRPRHPARRRRPPDAHQPRPGLGHGNRGRRRPRPGPSRGAEDLPRALRR